MLNPIKEEKQQKCLLCTQILFFVVVFTIGALLSYYADAAEPETIILDQSNIVRVYDGDTFTITIKDIPRVFGYRVGVRVDGIDTPELVSHCQTVELKAAERNKAILARDMLKVELANASIIELRNVRRDKYFRLLATVFVDGVPVNNILLESGLAHRYDGGEKISWCYLDN